MSSSSTNVSTDPIEQEINEDMTFIANNISAGDQRSAIIEGFQWELLRRRRRGRGADAGTLFAQYENVMQQMNTAAQSGNYAVGCFNTLHGGPLSPAEIGGGIPPIFRVPDGCIIAMLAPPGTVVYGGEEEDMMSWRFFKQKYCFGAAGSSRVENCFGADGKKASIKRNLDQADQFEIPPDEKQKVKDMSPGEFVAWKREKRNEKIEAKEDRATIRKNQAQGECSDAGKAEIRRQMRPEVHVAGGHEILENMQLFFGRIFDGEGNELYPGDWVYNQAQNWEQLQGRDANKNPIFDPNFDMFMLGSVFPRWLDTFDTTTFNPDRPPAGTELPNLTGRGVVNLEVGAGSGSPPCSLFTGQTPSMLHPLSAQLRGVPMTTQVLAQRLASAGCRFMVLNSCSPYQTPQDRHKGKKGSKRVISRVGNSAIANLLLRNYLMGAGRENFCHIRQGCIGKIGLSSGNVVVPQYDDHRGITISMTDDREEFYQTIGELLARSTTEPIFSPRIFRTILDLCDKSDKTGKQLQIFHSIYNRFYSEDTNASRDKYKLLPFEQELELLEVSRLGIHATDINAERGKRFASMRGGRKKRRRRKRKTKRKRKKNRKKRARNSTRKKKGRGKVGKQPTGGNIKKAGEFLLKNYYKYNPPIDTDNFGMEHARLQRLIALDMDEGKPIQEIMKGHGLKRYIQEGVNNNGEVTTLIMGGKKTKRKGKRKTRKRRSSF